ncbi:MAG: CGGC domain-containing protein, partial [Acidobacteria bacterium]|nr:CGGC domain-containing protein [Acidobacteriota bacterium]
PNIRRFKELIETKFEIPVVIGTHPIPLKYAQAHEKLSFWKSAGMEALAGGLMREDKKIQEAYN